MVRNEGVLQLNGPQSITGSFTQTGAGVLDLGIAGKASGQYGALDIAAAASLDGGLVLYDRAVFRLRWETSSTF